MAADRYHLEAVIRRGKRFGFCCMDQPSDREMVDDADESMFSQLINSNHVLHQLIPPHDVIFAMISDLDTTIVYSHRNLTVQ